MPTDRAQTSDRALLERARRGDRGAYGELWSRHAASAHTVARSYSTLDPDDLVAESFTRIYDALLAGGGPATAFRPYLFTTIRNTAASWGRARQETSLETLDAFEDPSSTESASLDALDRSTIAQAFRALPGRWQEVLWYAEVEGMAPQQVAPLVGMSANATAALAYRAREGLRQAWIQVHLGTAVDDPDCRWAIERLGGYTRGRSSPRATARLEAHLDECARCTIAAAEAREVSSRLALVLLPLATGIGGASAYSAWMSQGAPVAHLALGAGIPAAFGGAGSGVPSPGAGAASGASTGASGATASGGVGGIAVGAAAGVLVVATVVVATMVLPTLGTESPTSASDTVVADAPTGGGLSTPGSMGPVLPTPVAPTPAPPLADDRTDAAPDDPALERDDSTESVAPDGTGDAAPTPRDPAPAPAPESAPSAEPDDDATGDPSDPGAPILVHLETPSLELRQTGFHTWHANVTGDAGATVQVLIDGSPTGTIVLDGSGRARVVLVGVAGESLFGARYIDGDRIGPVAVATAAVRG